MSFGTLYLFSSFRICFGFRVSDFQIFLIWRPFDETQDMLGAIKIEIRNRSRRKGTRIATEDEMNDPRL